MYRFFDFVSRTVAWTAILTATIGLPPTDANGQDKSNAKKSVTVPKQVNAAFEPPVIDDTLPNVLLIGDSISIGYMLPVRKALAGQANVFRPATNCGPTIRGIEQIEIWIGDRSWDVVHFNFGLHDVKYMGPTDQNLADPSDPTSHQQVSIQDYLTNLRQIAQQLKATGAVVIWCATTPIPEGAKGRVPGDEVRYNAAAAALMDQIGGILTNDLYQFVVENALEEQKKADVHFTPAGSELLAKQVADSIRSAMSKK